MLISALYSLLIKYDSFHSVVSSFKRDNHTIEQLIKTASVCRVEIDEDRAQLWARKPCLNTMKLDSKITHNVEMLRIGRATTQ